jgi:hypothetical protein
MESQRGIWEKPNWNLSWSQKEFERGTCYGLVHPKLWTNSNTRPTQKHKHTPTNKSKWMQRFVSELDLD